MPVAARGSDGLPCLVAAGENRAAGSGVAPMDGANALTSSSSSRFRQAILMGMRWPRWA